MRCCKLPLFANHMKKKKKKKKDIVENSSIAPKQTGSTTPEVNYQGELSLAFHTVIFTSGGSHE